ncbi:MAG TPA: cyclodeaminase/cyclohydrolase family protein [Ktedonobacteraceae bacterium]|nr:cyclodeaminase/cyclohydrolase family protein [Ktedonobacteraceae bacterium]
MYLDQPLQQYLDDLASSKSTPGGGSASALSGAMGAALASMVARLTVGKTGYEEVQDEVKSIIQQTENLRLRFQELIQADIQAYEQLSACFKLPHSTDEEKANRAKAIQERLVDAALVPLDMVERAVELVQLCQRIAEIGNVNVISDIAAGSMLASSTGASASWMVRVNMRAMKDLEMVNALSTRLTSALDSISEGNQRVTAIVGGRA